MSWIDTTVIVAVVIVGVIILYKALKEPIDFLFRLIGKGFGAIRDMISNAGDTGGRYYEEIRYGWVKQRRTRKKT